MSHSLSVLFPSVTQHCLTATSIFSGTSRPSSWSTKLVVHLIPYDFFADYYCSFWPEDPVHLQKNVLQLTPDLKGQLTIMKRKRKKHTKITCFNAKYKNTHKLSYLAWIRSYARRYVEKASHLMQGSMQAAWCSELHINTLIKHSKINLSAHTHFMNCYWSRVFQIP